jgi:hypothetical protein
MRSFAIGIALAALACAGQSAYDRDRAYDAGVAKVARIDVTEQRQRPVSVDVTVHGELPDGCTLIHRTLQERRPTGITVTLTTRRESGSRCPAEAYPYVHTFTLDIAGLPSGLYFISVNGVSSTFEIPPSSIQPNPSNRFPSY